MHKHNRHKFHTWDVNSNLDNQNVFSNLIRSIIRCTVIEVLISVAVGLQFLRHVLDVDEIAGLFLPI